MIDTGSAEEFYSRCLSSAAVLDGVARTRAGEGAAVAAVALAWGADVYVTQAVLWERINVASRAPARRFFEAAGQLTAGLSHLGPLAERARTCFDVLRLSRDELLSACEESLRRQLESSWPAIDYLAALPAPTDLDFDAHLAERLGGVGWQQFATQRGVEAHKEMAEAQACRIRSAIDDAVNHAYASDLLVLDAYLVESAVASGDDLLVTVDIRWELAVHAVRQLAGLPVGFTAATEMIRQAMCSGLGDADGHRLSTRFIPV